MVHDMCLVRPALLYLNVQVLKVFYEQINYYYYYYYYYYNYSRRSRTALYKLNQHRHRLDSDRSYHFFFATSMFEQSPTKSSSRQTAVRLRRLRLLWPHTSHARLNSSRKYSAGFTGDIRDRGGHSVTDWQRQRGRPCHSHHLSTRNHQ